MDHPGKLSGFVIYLTVRLVANKIFIPTLR